jgi:hypothetical protein
MEPDLVGIDDGQRCRIARGLRANATNGSCFLPSKLKCLPVGVLIPRSGGETRSASRIPTPYSAGRGFTTQAYAADAQVKASCRLQHSGCRWWWNSQRARIGTARGWRYVEAGRMKSDG